jgi:hypothetical protein
VSSCLRAAAHASELGTPGPTGKVHSLCTPTWIVSKHTAPIERMDSAAMFAGGVLVELARR